MFVFRQSIIGVLLITLTVLYAQDLAKYVSDTSAPPTTVEFSNNLTLELNVLNTKLHVPVKVPVSTVTSPIFQNLTLQTPPITTVPNTTLALLVKNLTTEANSMGFDNQIQKREFNTSAQTPVLLYSERERYALDQFRKLLTDTNATALLRDYQSEDNYLIRWLRARNFDVGAANRMLLISQRWRRHNRIDNLLNEVVASFSPLPYKIGGSDNEGNPLIMFTPTNLDLRRLLINGKNMSRYWDQILEDVTLHLRIRRNTTGKPVTQVISLMDLHGFNLRQHGCLACFGVYIDWITDYENYYPELAKHIIWINAPRVFVAVLELVKPLMSPATAKALRVFGTNRPEWSAYLHKIIPIDQLTFRFGGAKKGNSASA